MKKIITIGILLSALVNAAQPIIQNGNNIPSVGTTASLYSGTPVSGIGNPGANQVWNFSNVAFNNTGATWTVVSPASTPYFSSFPTATYAWTFNAGGTTKYFYFNITSSKFYVLADNILMPGSGNDYTPNSEAVLRFPFNYGDTIQDVYQKVGGSPSPVTATYDGYGTLITPYATYQNVWRVKENKNGYVTYTWENENPLQPILVYTQSNNSFTLFGNTAFAGISMLQNSQSAIYLYPNPFANTATLKINSSTILKNAEFKIYDVLGKEVKQIKVDASEITINRDELGNGIYFYKLINDEAIIATGKLIVN